MRVIAGSAKGTLLFAPKGLRPTSDRSKQTLFDTLLSLAPLPDDVADFFAGSGALGIEALSRGAGKALFVEKSRDAVRHLERNLERTHLAGRATIVNRDVFSALPRLAGAPFSLVLADPPYGGTIASQFLHDMMSTAVLQPDGLLVLETSVHTEVDIPQALSIVRDKKTGDTRLLFLRREA